MTAPRAAGTVARWGRISQALDTILGASEPAAAQAALAALAAEDPAVYAEVVALLGQEPGTEPWLALPREVAGALAESADNAPFGPLGAVPEVVGGWRIVRPLGRGGMGEVYLAERTGEEFTQEGALKLLRRGIESVEGLLRFRQERQILARLSHPHIARLLDGGVAADGRPYFVLEHVAGEPLTTYAARQALDVPARLRLFLHVLGAVEAAHQLLVVHRDLKPSNVLVTAGGDVKLLDFGIAKWLSEEPAANGAANGADSATRFGQAPFTPAYAAPEQLFAGTVSTATDAYSLGVMLYELLVGVRPFQRETGSAGELLARVEQETAPRPSDALRRQARQQGAAQRQQTLRRARQVAGDLDAIVLRALAGDPARRYPTVAAFAADVSRWLDGRPVAARGDARGYRLRKFARRHRVALAAAALVVLSLAVGLAVALGQAHRAAREARRAQETQQFLLGLFVEADPTRSRGETITVRRVLDAAAARLQQGFTVEPESRGAIAETLSRTYFALGALDPAAHWATVAERENRQALGPEAPVTLLSQLVALEVAVERGEVARALPALEALLPRLDRAAGAESPEAVRGRIVFAAAQEVAGDFAAAVALRRGALDTAERAHGRDHSVSAGLLAAIGSAEANRAHYAAAEAALEEALARFDRGGNADLPDALRTRASLADLLETRGRLAEALPLFERAVADTRRVLGADHPWLGDMLLKQGFALVNGRRLTGGNLTGGQLAAGRAALEEAAAIYQPLDHSELGAAWRYLAIADMIEGQFADAEARLLQAECWFVDHLGADHTMVWSTRATRAHCLSRLGRLSEAEGMLREAIDGLVRWNGPDTAAARVPRKHLGEVLRRTGRVVEALALHREVLAVEEAFFAPGQGQRAFAASHLQIAQDLAAQGNHAALAAAVREADRAVELLVAAGGEDERLAEAREIRARILAARAPEAPVE